MDGLSASELDEIKPPRNPAELKALFALIAKEENAISLSKNKIRTMHASNAIYTLSVLFSPSSCLETMLFSTESLLSPHLSALEFKPSSEPTPMEILRKSADFFATTIALIDPKAWEPFHGASVNAQTWRAYARLLCPEIFDPWIALTDAQDIFGHLPVLHPSNDPAATKRI